VTRDSRLVPVDELMTIGRFSRLSGLSIHALRHYDDVELLHPAEVDASTGYRRYLRSQLTTARMIVDLRWLDVPLEDVRVIVEDPAGADAHRILADHRARLQRTRGHVARQLASIDRHLEEGISMPTPISGLAPVQIKITVEDLDAGRAFYRDAFGLEEQTVRHTDEADYPAFQFGTYGKKDFFLLHLLASDGPEFDRPGPSTFGLLVEELDEAHATAFAAGATELIAPKDAEGMPRHSALRDPSGNCVWLYQG
jgi:DNA-binding transcriptional MerR regulator